ncbi:NADP-dependent malic enzyme [Candidatus Falkowbacteria bacterium]|nr:NADP-dependent malic enzyme [Candidatus Falkowbacteria bacterium]
MDVYQEALELHRKHRGKLSINSKVSLKDKKSLSLAYTPGVAEVCRLIASDKEAAKTHTIKGNTIAVVSDGSAILGLGNLGPEAALPVMEGKCALFKEFAGVDAFPICLATQDTEEIIKAVKQISPVFGGINLEDISAPRCFEIEARLKAELDIPVFHDDQHGTATIVLSALINALKLSGLEKEKARLVINGAGAAGDAVSRLLLSYGFKDLIVVDSKGTISKNRQDLNSAKIELANLTNPRNIEGALAEALVGANIFIGVSAPGVLSEEMIKTMSEKPIVFALANPVPEIMPDLAKNAGAYIVATGRSDFPNQINNVLAFPGIFRGALDNKVKDINDRMLVQAAVNLAALVEDLGVDKILPDPFDERVAPAVAGAIK